MDMKRICILGCIIGCLGLAACEKSTDRNLRGRWQFRYCEYPAGGTFAYDSAFYSFDREVFELQKLLSSHTSLLRHANYTIEGDSLYIFFLSFDGQKIDVPYVLKKPPFDWNADGSKRFAIEEVSGSRLTLSCHDTIYHFRKF